ncbi:uncharacterized protein LOC142351523 [Convolutriloba macropyga]|uniref:uncharacterized protein LOC142351523 n=1 Tax=Convolutriloba macropyga TaxID=536237 RepID=UPI003F52349F
MPPKVDQFGFVLQTEVPANAENNSPNVEQKSQQSEEYTARNRVREMKWIDMFNRWEFFIKKNQRKLRDRCRKGIPQSCRGKAWLKLTSASKLQQHRSEIYGKLMTKSLDKKTADEICKDLHRTLPQHSMFVNSSGQGQTKLFEVLKCYALYNPRIGYCQGLSPLAAVLLLYMDCEEAFWVLVRVCDVYLIGYFDESMRGIQIDALIFRELCKKFLPKHYTILSRCQVDFVTLVQKWFFCLFSRTLPWHIVLRVWDCFFFEGKWCLFRIGLTLLKYSLIEFIVNPSQPADDFVVLKTISSFNTETLHEERFLMKSLDFKITSEAKKKLNELCTRQFEKKKAEEIAARRAQQEAESNRGSFLNKMRYMFKNSKSGSIDQPAKNSGENEHKAGHRGSGRRKNRSESLSEPIHTDMINEIMKNDDSREENPDTENTTMNTSGSRSVVVEVKQVYNGRPGSSKVGHCLTAPAPDVKGKFARTHNSLSVNDHRHSRNSADNFKPIDSTPGTSPKAVRKSSPHRAKALPDVETR